MKSEDYEYVYQKLLATLRKNHNDPSLKITALNLKLFEKAAYMKAFSSKV